jgi:hypothetical protein
MVWEASRWKSFESFENSENSEMCGSSAVGGPITLLWGEARRSAAANARTCSFSSETERKRAPTAHAPMGCTYARPLKWGPGLPATSADLATRLCPLAVGRVAAGRSGSQRVAAAGGEALRPAASRCDPLRPALDVRPGGRRRRPSATRARERVGHKGKRARRAEPELRRLWHRDARLLPGCRAGPDHLNQTTPSDWRVLHS